MEPMSLRKRRAYFYLLVVVFFAAIPPIILYTNGYRLGPNFTLVETGGMYVYAPESGAQVYIDSKAARKANIFQRDWFLDDLTPRTYTVLIEKEGFWPWYKEVTVEEQKVAEAIAFLIPKDPEIELIPRTIQVVAAGATTTRANAEFTELFSLFNEKTTKPDALLKTIATTSIATSTIAYEKISSRGRVGIIREDNRLIAYWLKRPEDLPNFFCRSALCQSPIVAFSSVVPIRSFDFYPGRDDVLIVALQNGIFAVEIDARKIQNFQPIYKGDSPDFRLSDKGFIVKDGATIFRVTL